jgi:flagellar basal-body rod protein FlgB
MRITDLVIRNALSIEAQRESLLAANIANADVAGFVPTDVDFGRALDQALESGRDGLSTQPAPITAVARPEDLRVDGSGVDLTREMGKLFENSLAYETTMKLYASMMARLKNATAI